MKRIGSVEADDTKGVNDSIVSHLRLAFFLLHSAQLVQDLEGVVDGEHMLVLFVVGGMSNSDSSLATNSPQKVAEPRLLLI